MGRISGQFSPGRRIVARCRHQTHGAGSRETSHGGAEIGVRLIDAWFATNLSPTGFPVRDRESLTYLRCLNRGDREGTDTASATLRLSAGQNPTIIFPTHADQRGVSSSVTHKYLLFSGLLPHVGLCRVQRAFLILRSLLGLPSVFTRST